MKFFQENGELTEYAQMVLSYFQFGLRQIMENDLVGDMSENELRLLGSHLHKMIGNAITDKIARKESLANQFSHLTDEQFTDYLKNKYGEEMWFFSGLMPEELKRVEQMAKMSLEDLRAALEQGAKDVEAIRQAEGNVFPDPGVRFKG